MRIVCRKAHTIKKSFQLTKYEFDRNCRPKSILYLHGESLKKLCRLRQKQ